MIIRQQRRAERRAAFTLVEVMVVIAIIVVLAGVGGVSYLRYLEDAKKDAARAQCKILAVTVQTYQVKYGDYPPSLASLTQQTADGARPYLDPSALVDPWQRPYEYAAPGTRGNHQATGEPDIWSQGGNLGDPNGVLGNW